VHNPFDQLAKKVGKGALDTSGATIVQYEISRLRQQAPRPLGGERAQGARAQQEA
jgi:hypothetical protein